MGIHIQTTTEHVNWERVEQILKEAGLCEQPAKIQERAFKNSYAVSFLYDDKKLIGVGRALSDGVSQAAIFNIALDKTYRGRQLGRRLIESVIEQVKEFSIILYTHPQTIAMYEKFGFRRMKTGMAIYQGSHVEFMEEEGFLLPKRYRFGDNQYERRECEEKC